MRRYPLPPVPDGWYGVARSESLAAGELRPLHFFGRELVLFRNEAGAARLFDAHCPHLGAHLGHGGRVEGDGVRCPFHGWRFDAEGLCVEVPRSRRPPPRVRARSYPVMERNDCVLAWFHAREQQPDWEVPDYRAGGSGEWTDWVTEGYDVRTHVQDMGENILDLPHFWNVHDMDDPAERHFATAFEGPEMRVEQTLRVTGSGEAGVEVLARTTNSGPGISATRVEFGPVRTLTFITQTPVDEDRVRLELSFCMRRMEDPEAAAAIERANREFINLQFRQDIPIWEHKIYRERPPLTELDGPVPRYRRWFRQFYSELEDL